MERSSIEFLNELKGEYSLNNQALDIQAVFLAGAQPAYQDQCLARGYDLDRIDSSRLLPDGHPLMQSWHKAWGIQQAYWDRLHVSAGYEHQVGLLLAAAVRVDYELTELTGAQQGLVVPPAYGDRFPRYFGGKQALVVRLPEVQAV